MEYCDTSLATYIQASDDMAVNWAECVRYLMDGAAGLFERATARKTYTDRSIDRLSQTVRQTEVVADR